MGHGASSKVRRYKSEPVVSDTKTGNEGAPVGKASSTGSHRKRTSFRGAKLKVNASREDPAISGIRWTSNIASEYKIGTELMPSTNYGTTVHHAKRLSDGRDVVVKVRNKAMCFPADGEAQRAWRLSTRYLLQQLPRHEHIAHLHDVLEDQEAYYVVMEKVDGLDLFDTMVSTERPDRSQVQQILKQLLEAVALLHDRGYIHRDLKLENVMLSPKSTRSKAWSSQSFTPVSKGECCFTEVDEQGVASSNSEACGTSVDEARSEPLVKLIDFDTVEDYSPMKTAKVVMGTDMYIAQEAYEGRYSPASDVFAIGVIAYKLLTGVFPFSDTVFTRGDNTVGSPCMKKTQESVKQFQIDWSRPPLDSDKQVMELCKWMLSPLDADRPTAKQAREHPWFSEDLA